MMIDGAHMISVCGQQLMLLPQRAVFWQTGRTLLIADPHFGKAGAFRTAGVPVPPGTTADDLARLDQLVRHLQPERVVVLGDLLHAKIDAGQQMLREVARWRSARPRIELILVAGNHDRRAGTVPPAFGVDAMVEKLRAGPFEFRHRPESTSSAYVFAGHVHPAVRLTGKGGQKETLPCYRLAARFALLPSFGSMTGNHVIRPAPQERIYVIADAKVVPVGA